MEITARGERVRYTLALFLSLLCCPQLTVAQWYDHQPPVLQEVERTSQGRPQVVTLHFSARDVARARLLVMGVQGIETREMNAESLSEGGSRFVASFTTYEHEQTRYRFQVRLQNGRVRLSPVFTIAPSVPPALLQVQREIQEVDAAVSRLERALAELPPRGDEEALTVWRARVTQHQEGKEGR